MRAALDPEPVVDSPAVDSHVHLFDPARFPYRQNAPYLPAPHETATLEQLQAVLAAHGLSHAVLVTPTSGYGSDNSAAAAAIARNPERLKGIALVEHEASEDEIAGLKSAGFVGLRFDLIGRRQDLLTGAGRRLVAILREQDMLLDIQCEAASLDGSAIDLLRHEAGRVVIDHMGRPDVAAGLDQPGFARLIALAELENVAIKLSGPFRFSQAGFPYADTDAYAGAIIAAFGPERCVWGSDWPFVRMDHRVDYGPCLAALDRWLPEPTARRKVLWDTPAQLFRFEPLT